MIHKVNTLYEIGLIPVSSTTEYRVGIVRDVKNRIRVSLQVWWRTDENGTWTPGKGFYLDKQMTQSIVKHLRKAVDTCEMYEASIPLTDTQQHRITKLLDKDLVVISKWWHKGDQKWVEGKCLALHTHEILNLAHMLEIATTKLVKIS